MKMDALKMLARAGAVKNAQLVPAPMISGKFNILVDINQGTWQTTTVERRRGGTRNFSSAEAAFKVVKNLGLTETLVKLN